MIFVGAVLRGVIARITIGFMTRSIPGRPDQSGRLGEKQEVGATPNIAAGQALWLTALSVLTPGVAHWRAGKNRTALVLASASLTVWIVVAISITTLDRTELMALAVRPSALLTLFVAALLIVPTWIWVVVSSYRVLRPADPDRRSRFTQVGVLGLCAAVALPPLAIANLAYNQYDLVTTVFQDKSSQQAMSAAAPPPDAEQTQPLPGVRRLNVLLLGSDAGPGRTEARTDTMVLASIDQETGRTVLFSLPRNLQHAPMPSGPARDQYPGGFTDLLNAVYREGAEYHPEFGEGAEDPGADLMKGTVSEILDLPVHHYAMVNMAGFNDMVDAMGGVDLNVAKEIPMGDTGASFEPGEQNLDGEHALWYARSRTGGSDYDRMERQRCMIGALSDQADPMSVLRHYDAVADVAKANISTDIPAEMLQNLAGLAEKIDPQSSVQFTPPLIKPASPDYGQIRSIAQDTIRQSEAEQEESGQTGGDGSEETSELRTC